MGKLIPFFLFFVISSAIANAHGGYQDFHSTVDYGRIAAVSIFLISVLLFILLWKGKIGMRNDFDKSLSNNKLVGRILASKKYKLFLQIPALLVFLGIIFLGFFDIQKSGWNLATIFTWTIWWTLLIIFIIFLGRLWCTMCPAAAMGDWSKKAINLKKRYPYKLRNSWLQIALFVLLTLAFFIFDIGKSPFLTSVLLVALVAVAIIFGMIFERRTFCRYVCPIGGMLGVYSLLTPIELRSKSDETCFNHIEKDCVRGNKNSEGCGMLLYPGNLDSNKDCNFCMDCYKACPKDNLSLNIRNFGKDLWNSKIRRLDDVFLVIFLLGITFVHTFFMLTYWEDVSSTILKGTGTGWFTISFLIIGLFLPVALFFVAAYVSRAVSGGKLSDTLKRYGYMFIPVALAMHLAHNLNHLFTESWSIMPAFKRLLAKIGFENLKIVWSQNPWFNWHVLYFLQSLVILLGVYFAFKTIVLSTRTMQDRKRAFWSIIPFVLLSLGISLINIYVLAMPMAARQAH